MASAAVDLEHLDRYTGGDPALNAEILRLFDSQANDMVASLQAIIDSRDAKSWKQVLHTLKGAARGIGAFGLGDAAAAAEPIDLARDRDVAGSALAVIEDKATTVRLFIESYLGA